jgi:nitrogen fixation/metabolism regulation signal transduction histidine kinase
MNIIDNSIYWLDTIYKQDKGIYFKTYLENDFPVITIVDNGPGFKDGITDLVRPFFSRKDDGIGIGLYLIDTIMMKYGKFEILENSELEDIEIPTKYRGAAIKLTFNKNQ